MLAKSVPGGIDGVEIATNESLDPKDPQVALYEAVMAQYAPGTPPHESGDSGGFAAVVGFARAMTGVTGELTPAKVRAQLASMRTRHTWTVRITSNCSMSVTHEFNVWFRCTTPVIPV